MAVPLRRFLFGVFWFGIFWMALSIIGGGIATSLSGTRPPASGSSVQQGYVPVQAVEAGAGIRFQERYGLWVVLGAAVLAGLCTGKGWLPGTRKS